MSRLDPERSELGKPEITIGTNHVVVCNHIVQRPASISPSQWFRFWEKVKKI